MKLLTSLKKRAFTSITASSTKSGFPASHLEQLDPGLVWIGDASSANIVIDLGAPVAIPYIWLNNANFLLATLQANSANSWDTPAVSLDVTLAADDINIIKGFFALSATNYRYVRLVIPSQTFTDGESEPSLGNIIIGETVELRVSEWEPQDFVARAKFSPDGGGFRAQDKGRPRHIFNASAVGTKAQIDAMPLKGWSHAVIFTDLGDPADSYLVYPPETKRGRVRNPSDVERSFVLEELV